MEDAHTHILSLHDDKNAAFFAVYDGHGGSKVAEYAGHHLHERIFSQQAYSKLQQLSLQFSGGDRKENFDLLIEKIQLF
jgi:serine/threonine protein phosphatase PrpC